MRLNICDLWLKDRKCSIYCKCFSHSQILYFPLRKSCTPVKSILLRCNVQNIFSLTSLGKSESLKRKMISHCVRVYSFYFIGVNILRNLFHEITIAHNKLKMFRNHCFKIWLNALWQNVMNRNCLVYFTGFFFCFYFVGLTFSFEIYAAIHSCWWICSPKSKFIWICTRI